MDRAAKPIAIDDVATFSVYLHHFGSTRDNTYHHKAVTDEHSCYKKSTRNGSNNSNSNEKQNFQPSNTTVVLK